MCYYVGGFNTLSYLIPQLILSALTCVFIYLLAKCIFDERVAFIAGIAAALYPDLIFWAYKIRVETFFIFLLTAGFLFLVSGNVYKKLHLVCAGGVFFGLACLTRITLIPFIPALFIWEMIFYGSDWRENFKAAIFTVLIITLLLFPWCMRNFVVFGEFTPFTSETKAVLLGAEKPESYAECYRYSKLYKSATLRTAMFIKDNIGEYMVLSARRYFKFWSPCTFKMKKLAQIYKSLIWIILFPAAFYGMISSMKRWNAAGLLIVFILYYSLLHAGSFVDDGLVYRYPIQPFICIFAAHGFITLSSKICNNGKNCRRAIA
jgi:4-amino-4-deoxy-L-arabinose transferase-like glycosyltransferase